MKKYVSNIRFWILVFSFSLSILLFLVVSLTFNGSLQIIRLTQIYGFTAILYLYVTLLIGPLCFQLSFLSGRGMLIKARRALGISSCYFGTLHALNAFFRQLGGINGLEFLSSQFLFGICLSFVALLILFLLTITSTEYMIRLISYKKWKFLHRFVYLAGFLILFHVLLLGSHFGDLSGSIPLMFFFAGCFLWYLEAVRFDAFLERYTIRPFRFGLVTTLSIAAAGSIFLFMMLPEGKNSPFGIHNEHKTMDTMNSSPASTGMTSMPGMNGDPSKRYSVSFFHPDEAVEDQPVELRFDVNDASTGQRILFFQTPYEKPLHLIIVDQELTYFSHVHPLLDSKKGFIISHTFPHSGIYHLYTDFLPFGAREQQFGFTLQVGNDGIASPKPLKIETSRITTIQGYDVSMTYPEPLRADLLTQGKAPITFHIRDTKSGKDITTLSPYLNAYGHFVMINSQTYEYIHVHPTKILPPDSVDPGGPDVTFLPFGLNGPIKSGTYRLFVEFHPDNTMIVPSFTITIE